MYQKGSRLFVLFVVIMLSLTLYFVPYSHAMEIKGKVVKVDGDAITILLEGKMMPMEGDIATLFFEHEQLGEMQIGEWKITKVTYPTASAVKINATGDARGSESPASRKGDTSSPGSRCLQIETL